MATVIGGLRVDLTLNSAAFIRDMAKSYVRNRTEKCRFSSPFCLGTAILDEFLCDGGPARPYCLDAPMWNWQPPFSALTAEGKPGLASYPRPGFLV
jgi:hypothetical protein